MSGANEQTPTPSGLHWWVTGGAAIAVVLVVILSATGVIAPSTGFYLQTAAAALCLLGRPVVEFISPRRAAMPALAAGYSILLLGVLAFLWPAGHLARTGVKRNKAWANEVVGPGDEGTIYFTQTITSVKGYWSGSPRVTLLNLNELGLQGAPLADFGAKAKNDNWGGGISVSSKESKTSSPTLWAIVKIPDDARLAGKTVKLRIIMAVNYPQLQGGSQFVNTSGTFQHDVTLELAGEKAGAAYSSACMIGLIAGLLLTGAGGAVLALASPTDNNPPRPRRRRRDEDEEDEDEEDERPRRRRDPDEEEDRPRRGRRAPVEEEDKPRRRRSEEDEEKPRRRRGKEDY